MSTPPPPIASPGPASVAPETAWSDTGDAGRASRLPLIFGIIAFVVGAALLLVTWNNVVFGLIGYLLSGFTLTLLVGWDVVAQRKGMKNPNFVMAPKQSTFLRVLVFAGFVVAIIHLYSLATIWAEQLSDLWGLQ